MPDIVKSYPTKFKKGDFVSLHLKESGILKNCQVKQGYMNKGGVITYDIDVLLTQISPTISEVTSLYGVEAAYVTEKEEIIIIPDN
jgi:hypothetical protein